MPSACMRNHICQVYACAEVSGDRGDVQVEALCSADKAAQPPVTCCCVTAHWVSAGTCCTRCSRRVRHAQHTRPTEADVGRMAASPAVVPAVCCFREVMYQQEQRTVQLELLMQKDILLRVALYCYTFGRFSYSQVWPGRRAWTLHACTAPGCSMAA